MSANDSASTRPEDPWAQDRDDAFEAAEELAKNKLASLPEDTRDKIGCIGEDFEAFLLLFVKQFYAIRHLTSGNRTMHLRLYMQDEIPTFELFAECPLGLSPWGASFASGIVDPSSDHIHKLEDEIFDEDNKKIFPAHMVTSFQSWMPEEGPDGLAQVSYKRTYPHRGTLDLTACLEPLDGYLDLGWLESDGPTETALDDNTKEMHEDYLKSGSLQYTKWDNEVTLTMVRS